MIDTIRQILATDVSWLWISARTFGICAWWASSVTVIVGLVISTRLFGPARGVRVMSTVHPTAATLTLVFVMGHIATLVPDPYAKLTLLDSVIPGQAPNNTVSTALGTIAFLALLLVSLAGTLRRYVGRRAWNTIHSVAFIVWPLASIHFIVMGTDALAVWSLASIGVVTGLLVLLLIRRGFAAPRAVALRAGVGGSETSSTVVGRPIRSAELTLTRVIAETDTAKTFVFGIPPEHAAAFTYLPGQHLTLQIPSLETGSVARCYSLSSAPGVDQGLSVTVKRTSNGYASNWLCDNATPGLRLRALKPSGTFCPTPGMGELLLFAGGSGVTPMMSMIKSAVAAESRRVVLVYANRDEASIIFDKELLALQRYHPDLVTIHHWLQSESGNPTANDVTEVLARHRAAEIFICGPGPFMQLVARTAGDFGWPQARIHIEEFRSLVGDPFEPNRSRTSVGAADQVNSATLTRTSVAHVELKGETHVVQWAQDFSLVDALIDAGVDVPYSCLEGVCSTCECKLVAGSVESDVSAHNQGDRVLGCQIRPTTETVRVKF